jgi:hypothetical protein
MDGWMVHWLGARSRNPASGDLANEGEEANGGLNQGPGDLGTG